MLAFIQPRQLAAFASELQAVASEARPDLITVIYCDTHVRSTEEFTADDEIKLTAKGGGGTRFSPVFQSLASATDETGEPPACLIYFTDLDAPDRREITEPDYPVLWVTDLSVTDNGPFGQTVRIVL